MAGRASQCGPVLRDRKKKLTEDRLEFGLFALAERLGRTVAELKETMTADELLGWSAYDEINRERREAARE